MSIVIPNPKAQITVTIGDKTFTAGRRTYYHLVWTIARLAKVHPKAHLHVIQPCYNKGVKASAGTHDYDGVLDVQIIGLSWPDAQRFLRECGWAAWWRHTGSWAAESAWHIHMISLGCPGPVGEYIDGGKSLFGHVVASSQIADYYNHSLGLAGQHASGLDHSWFPKDIKKTIFNYSAYVRDNSVSLTRVRQAAKTPSWRLVLAPRTLKDRRRVTKALAAQGCDTYRQWQIKCGLKGNDLTGVPNKATLSALGDRANFFVQA